MTKLRTAGDKTSGPDGQGPDRDGPGMSGPGMSGPGMNLVVLKGRLSRPAELRVLPSGDRLVALELSVTRPGLRTEGVPVVWPDAPAAAEAFDVDQSVVVLGRVRRRFFRTAAGTQSRTEVVAESVVPARQSKRAGALVATAMVRLDTADP